MSPDADSSHLAVAYDDGDWEELIRRAPQDAEGTDALLVGHAHWFLGDVATAVRWLERGLADPGSSMDDLSPFQYAVGMGHFLLANLFVARRHLQDALDGPAYSPWRFPVLRGLSQVEMELGLLDAADARLRRLPGDASHQALQHVMRAKVAWRAGRVEASRANLWIALSEVVGSPPTSEDPHHLIDEASLLVTGAEILAAMGHGAESHRVLDAASARLEAAGRVGLPVETHLLLHRAMAHRLTGDLDSAAELLDRVSDAAVATDARDLMATVSRERARISHDLGDAASAQRLWADAAEQFDMVGYVWEAEAARREAASGPVADVSTEPIEHWFDEDADLHEDPPVGTVVSMVLSDGDHEVLSGIEALVEVLASRLAETTSGFIDGWGTSGDELEVFAYGDEPDRLWHVMEEPVRALGLDGTVRLEWGDRFELRLLRPPEGLAGLRALRPTIPPLSRSAAKKPPITQSALIAWLAAKPVTDRPDPEDLELLRTARLDRSRVWLWRWGTAPGDLYVTVIAAPMNPLIMRADPPEGLTPEQHLVSLHFAYRSNLPHHLW